MILKIKQYTYSSSSDYKLSTGKQLQGLETMTSYKFCREVRMQGILSKKGSLEAHYKELSLGKKTWTKTCFEYKGQPPLNRQNSE